MTKKAVVCYCGTQTIRKIITESIPMKGRTVVLEDVLADVCPNPNCGEIYFDGEMILDVEKQIRARENLAA